jgi:uncharacterized membrane protein
VKPIQRTVHLACLEVIVEKTLPIALFVTQALIAIFQWLLSVITACWVHTVLPMLAVALLAGLERTTLQTHRSIAPVANRDHTITNTRLQVALLVVKEHLVRTLALLHV